MENKNLTANQITQKFALEHPVVIPGDYVAVNLHRILQTEIPITKQQVLHLTTSVCQMKPGQLEWNFIALLKNQITNKALPLKFIGNKVKKRIKDELRRVAAGAGEILLEKIIEDSLIIRLSRPLTEKEIETAMPVLRNRLEEIETENSESEIQ